MPMVMARLGSSTVMAGSGDRVVGVGQRLADGDLGQAGDRDDLAGARRLGRHLLERLGHVQLGDLGLLDRAVEPAPGDGAALGQRRRCGPGRWPADPRRARRVRLQTSAWVGACSSNCGAGTWSMMAWKSGSTFGALDAALGADPARPGVGVEDGEGDLVLVGVEVQEQLLDLVDDLGDAGVGPVDLVDDEDDRQPGLEGLAQHEPGLGQRALGGVDQEEDAVDHGQAALDLAAEVGVAGGVDDVDLHPAPAHGRVLGQDGDALLALEVARVHDPVGQLLVGAEGAGLAQHGVDERRLAVVDVGHDGHVPDVLARSHGGSNDRGPGTRPSQAAERTGAPAPASTSATASAPRVSTAGSGSTRTRWPESGHHPTTRPGTAPPRVRSASTRVTSASSARTELAPRPRQHDEVGSRRAHVGPAAQGEEGGVGAVPPAVAADDGRRGRRRTSRGRTRGGSPTSPPRLRRPPGRREKARRPSGRAARRTSCRRAPSGDDSASRARTASTGRAGARRRRSRRTAASPRARRAVRADQAKGSVGRIRRPSPPNAVRTSWSVTRNGPAPARRTARSASVDLRLVERRAARTPRRRPRSGATNASGEPVSHRRRAGAGEPRSDVGGDRPEVLLAHVLDAVAAAWPIRAGPAGTGECRCAGSRAGRDSAATAAAGAQGPPVDSPSAQSDAVPGCGQADEQVEDAVQHHPTAGERDGDPVVGPRHPARGEPGHVARRFAGVGRHRLRQRGPRRGGQRLDVAHHGPALPRRAARRAPSPRGSSISPVCTSWRNNACTRRDRTAPSDRLAVGQVSRRRAPSASRAAGAPRGTAGGRARPGRRRRRRRRPRARPAGRRPGRGRSAAEPRRRPAAAPAPVPCRHPRSAPGRQIGAAGVGRRGPSEQCAHGV